MIFVFILILFVYCLTIGHLIYGFNQVKNYKSNDVSPKTFFAIVVPFRNESHHLPMLLESFKQLDYPKELFEIILIDDFQKTIQLEKFLIGEWKMESFKLLF